MSSEIAHASGKIIPPGGRIAFLDWLRGLAAIIMIQGHVFHSFTRPDQRDHGFFIYSQFLGGEAAAIFLFLTGITFGMGIAKRRDLPPLGRVLAALKRARYLFIVAMLFRLQLYLTGWGHTQLQDLLQVDILNIMGATTALLALVALLPDPLARFRWAVLAGAILAGFAPLMTHLDTTHVPAFVAGYLVPSAQFSLFPWGAFVAFGLACGSLIPLVPSEASLGRDSWNRIVQWAALAGFALILLGIYCAQLPFSIYNDAQFWLDSPALIACKMGTALLLGAVAFVWTEYLSPGPSWVRLLGTASLAVYWVHIEIVYGNSLWFWKEQLYPWESLCAAVGLVLTMTGMSWAIHRLPWREWRLALTASAPAVDSDPA